MLFRGKIRNERCMVVESISGTKQTMGAVLCGDQAGWHGMVWLIMVKRTERVCEEEMLRYTA